jgi:putative ABC transport system ATP-binding protein
MKYIVETKNLSKTYMQGKVPVRAVKNVDLKVKKGEYISILGPSGSGKSTLLNLIGALDVPTEGTVMINGTDISTLSNGDRAELRRKIGFVFQFFNLIPRLSALKNVELSMSIKNISKSTRREKARQILTDIGLGDRLDHAPSELSGGQQQRVAIARALAQDPMFLLMDEPTGNVDTGTRDVILGLIRRLNEEKERTIIMITHDMVIANQSNKIYYLVDGKLTDEPPKDKVKYNNLEDPDKVNYKKQKMEMEEE